MSAFDTMFAARGAKMLQTRKGVTVTLTDVSAGTTTTPTAIAPPQYLGAIDPFSEHPWLFLDADFSGHENGDTITDPQSRIWTVLKVAESRAGFQTVYTRAPEPIT